LNPGRDKNFSLLQNHPDQLWGAPSLTVGGFQGVKKPEREDHSPPSSAEVKNEWGYIFAPLICLTVVDRGSF
jgi:hypothetical protein